MGPYACTQKKSHSCDDGIRKDPFKHTQRRTLHESSQMVSVSEGKHWAAQIWVPYCLLYIGHDNSIRVRYDFRIHIFTSVLTPPVHSSTPKLRTPLNRSLFLRLRRCFVSADLERTNKKGLTPLQLSVRSGHLGVAEELLKRGARPNVTTKAGLCLRCLAGTTGHSYLAVSCVFFFLV